jgi:hypothetical protein
MKIIRQKLITGLERFFFKLALHRREKKIDSGFDRHLSREIDSLLILIEGGNGKK